MEIDLNSSGVVNTNSAFEAILIDALGDVLVRSGHSQRFSQDQLEWLAMQVAELQHGARSRINELPHQQKKPELQASSEANNPEEIKEPQDNIFTPTEDQHQQQWLDQQVTDHLEINTQPSQDFFEETPQHDNYHRDKINELLDSVDIIAKVTRDDCELAITEEGKNLCNIENLIRQEQGVVQNMDYNLQRISQQFGTALSGRVTQGSSLIQQRRCAEKDQIEQNIDKLKDKIQSVDDFYENLIDKVKQTIEVELSAFYNGTVDRNNKIEEQKSVEKIVKPISNLQVYVPKQEVLNKTVVPQVTPGQDSSIIQETRDESQEIRSEISNKELIGSAKWSWVAPLPKDRKKDPIVVFQTQPKEKNPTTFSLDGNIWTISLRKSLKIKFSSKKNANNSDTHCHITIDWQKDKISQVSFYYLDCKESDAVRCLSGIVFKQGDTVIKSLGECESKCFYHMKIESGKDRLIGMRGYKKEMPDGKHVWQGVQFGFIKD